MKKAYVNGVILDGTKDMEPVTHKVILVDGETITGIVDEDSNYEAYQKVDLEGQYIMPGLINLHVHLAGNGQPSTKPRDNAAMVRKIMSNGISRAIAYKLVSKYAKLELLGGVTTIRTVGGLGSFDTRCRDDIARNKLEGPRILASNEGISVPGGHMAGSVAIAAENVEMALAQVHKAKEQKVDWIKLMITGGVMDAKEKGTPGELKMSPAMVRAVCEEAHKLGYRVAAHTESPEGVKVALENGVDSIEHGAVMDEQTIQLYREKNAFLCTTISPALPYALFDPAVSGASEKDQYNVWRELFYFHKYCGVTNQFALYTATLQNAKLMGIDHITGSIAEGKCADMIVTKGNPLESLTNLRTVERVICRGKEIKNPNPKRKEVVDKELDLFLNENIEEILNDNGNMVL